MSTHSRATARMAMACILLAGTGACDANGEASAAAQSAQAEEARLVETLPLQPGYYVATDTPCEQASNATLHLMHRDGGGYGGFTTPPFFCEFVRIERIGASSYRVVETCGNAHGEGEGSGETVSRYEIVSETHYRATREDGWESSARRCPRRQLPGLWRDSGLGDFVD